MVLKANDRRTSCPCHDEFRGSRSDYVRQLMVWRLQLIKQNGMTLFAANTRVISIGFLRVRIDILLLFETVTVSDNRQQWSSDSFMGGTNF
ncbi:hypothetical protein TNCV_2603201 [Trichonephila clavipes]|nr:hypothetical protein TNCV_2603201 [Trichonephila clavipes]